MNIKIFLVDVDGTLTDGIYNVDENGKISKNFYTRDFDALRQLSEVGIDIFIITSATDSVIIEKCRRLPFHVEVHIGVIYKKAKMDEILSQYPMASWENVACIGDAENDIECLKAAAFSGCPSDAIEEIKPDVDKEISQYVAKHMKRWREDPDCDEEPFVCSEQMVDFVSDKPGGRGAVYDFAMEVLKRNVTNENEKI